MFALLLAFLPHGEVAPRRVDVIEVNHFIDSSTGKETFKQYIFRDYDGTDFAICDWRLAKGRSLTKCGEVWRAHLMDLGKMQSVEAASIVETWTDYDPELAERERVPQNKRRLLP